jgi:hypothetical protein
MQQMATIEELRGMFDSIPPAKDRRWSLLSVVPERLHLSKGELGEFSLFLEGERDSFGVLPAFNGVSHATDLTALPHGESVAALHIRSADQIHGDSALAHIAYEMLCKIQEEAEISNRELLNHVTWMFPILGRAPDLLTDERQRGLIGECIFLRELLLRAHALGQHPDGVLNRWWGHSPAKRDFAAVDIAIEVKTTTMKSRQHQIGSIEQLEPQTWSEQLFVYSIGLKIDPSSSRKLPVYVDEVEQLLVSTTGAPLETSLAQFHTQLRAWGYDAGRRTLYGSEPGYLPAYEVPGSLFRENDLDRLRRESFVDAQLPTMVTGVSYTLNITCEALSKTAFEQTLEQLLTSPALGEG